jgi:hypothetical protein
MATYPDSVLLTNILYIICIAITFNKTIKALILIRNILLQFDGRIVCWVLNHKIFKMTPYKMSYKL